MAEEILNLLASDDEKEECEVFGALDVDESEVRSDISFSDIERESSEEEIEAGDDET